MIVLTITLIYALQKLTLEPYRFCLYFKTTLGTEKRQKKNRFSNNYSFIQFVRVKLTQNLRSFSCKTSLRTGTNLLNSTNAYIPIFSQRCFAENGGTRGGISRCQPFFGPEISEDQIKKKGLCSRSIGFLE